MKNNAERVENIVNLSKKINLSIFDAIDGNDKNIINSYKNIQIQKILKPGEMGVYISHCEIWKNIITNNIQRAIVFEDDVNIYDNFHNDIENILAELPANFLYCQLHIPFFRNLSKPIVGKNIISQYENIYSAAGYIISLNGATSLLQYCAILNQPIDHCIIKFCNKYKENCFSISKYIMTALSYNPHRKKEEAANKTRINKTFKSLIQ